MREEILEELRDLESYENNSRVKLLADFSDEELIEFAEHCELYLNFNTCETGNLLRAYAECFGSHYLKDLEHVKRVFVGKGNKQSLVAEELFRRGVPQNLFQYIDFDKFFEKELSYDYSEYDGFVFS